MRLLVGLPADRRSELAQNWQIDGAGETVLAVALYRCMTDGAALALVIARLGDAERLIFQHLMRLRRFVSEGELLQALPFSEEQLTDALAALERLGLVWLGPPNPRADGERTWIVPNDLARALSVARHPPAAGRVLAQPSATRPSLMRFPLPVRPNVASDVVVDLIGSLGSSAVQCRDVRPETPVPAERAALDLAKRLGIGLGVWEKVSRGFRPAARYLHWQEATRLERRRAVARLWLVEERVPRAERALRRALWDALRDAEPEQWY
ncbi:MAG TPA: hypothetical protein VKX96_06145, partial [Chloroflexota bacterium]|nr:hypothetical protein [Chloroflexota bacterium]